jgi:hypothetical protein
VRRRLLQGKRLLQRADHVVAAVHEGERNLPQGVGIH